MPVSDDKAQHAWTELCVSIEKRHVWWCHKCGAIRTKKLVVSKNGQTNYVTWYLSMGTKMSMKHSPPCYPVKLHEECQGLAIALESAIAKLEKAESDNEFLRNELKELMPPI
jgi:hypothetical protein